MKVETKKWKWKQKSESAIGPQWMGRSKHGKGEEIHNNPPFSSFDKSESENKKWKWKKEKKASVNDHNEKGKDIQFVLKQILPF